MRITFEVHTILLALISCVYARFLRTMFVILRVSYYILILVTLF